MKNSRKGIQSQRETFLCRQNYSLYYQLPIVKIAETYGPHLRLSFWNICCRWPTQQPLSRFLKMSQDQGRKFQHAVSSLLPVKLRIQMHGFMHPGAQSNQNQASFLQILFKYAFVLAFLKIPLLIKRNYFSINFSQLDFE